MKIEFLLPKVYSAIFKIKFMLFFIYVESTFMTLL